MKKCMKPILALAALLLFAGCASPGAKTAKPYPLDTCIVTDNTLGSMGRPITSVHEGQEVKFCCAPCVKKFERDPERYLQKIKSS